MDNYKEYLNPKDGYALVKSSIDMPVHHTWIEIPAGATTAIYYVPTKKVYFWKGEDVHWDTGEWMDCKAAQLTTVTEFLEINESRIVWKRTTQDPALISGADALRALADGKEVEGFSEENEEWIPIVYFSVQEVVNGLYKFRLKPQTIKLELELPKPFEPEEDCHVYILDDGKTDGYRRYSYEVHGDKGNTFIGIWRTEDEIKQVVEQLRKIRGTNS
ncbi:hypothetical protein MQ669_003610 [Acinetobacter nosocomialis]